MKFSTAMICLILVNIVVLVVLYYPTWGDDKPVPAMAETNVEIGEGIIRTDDLEKGVSCYRFKSWQGALSCVKVNQ